MLKESIKKCAETREEFRITERRRSCLICVFKNVKIQKLQMCSRHLPAQRDGVTCSEGCAARTD